MIPVGVLLSLALSALGCGSGRSLPEAEALHLDGRPFRTSSVRGLPAWFEFWAPWDPASVQRMRDLVEIRKRHPEWAGKLRIVTVAVNCQPAEVREALPPGTADLAAVVIETGEFAETMGIQGVPATLLVDADGRYLRLREGYVEAPVLEEAVQALISGNSGSDGK